MPLYVAGLFRDRGVAERAIRSLIAAGVPEGEISLAVREIAEEDVRDRRLLAEGDDEFAQLAVHSAWERLGWQGGARPPYRNRVAPKIEHAILAAGPLALAIGGAQVGASAGGVVGAMANFGFALDTAREWYTGLVAGRAWLMVRTRPGNGDPIREVFARHQPELHAESLRHW
ncbi:MAG: DUF1269 domain-containing protein [Armatimonadetes bacterium]|nr:DUF1269 domain-containing protein [Armatimonadota bacterium]